MANRSKLAEIREQLRQYGPGVSPADLRITLLLLLDALGALEHRGRPRATAPVGRVTLERAAELSGLSKATVQRRIQDAVVPAITANDGTMSIARRDVRKLGGDRRVRRDR